MTKPSVRYAEYAGIPIEEQLRRRLSRLSYFAFAIAITRLLTSLGYSDIPVPKRKYFKGRTPNSGYDLVALHHTPLTVSPVLIQLKLGRGTGRVPKHFIDELRGVLLPEGVPSGLCISTCEFSQAAMAAARSFPGRPIRLVPGQELGRLMAGQRIGCFETEDPATGNRLLLLDQGWFFRLETYCDELLCEKGVKPPAHE